MTKARLIAGRIAAWIQNEKETNATKLVLIVVDKFLIGLAFAVLYFLFQAKLSSDAQKNEQARNETELRFMRAEYVKDLIPIVVDHDQDLLFRIHSLSALVHTQSIDANSAVGLAQEILSSGALGNTVHVPFSSLLDGNVVSESRLEFENGQDAFEELVLATMPDGIPAVLAILERFEGQERLENFESVPNELFTKRRLAMAFWTRVLSEAMLKYPAERLHVLSTAEFYATHSMIACDLLDQVPVDEALEWRRSENFVLKIIAELVLFIDQRDRMARSRLVDFLQSEHSDNDHLLLQGTLLQQLNIRDTHEPEIDDAALSILLLGDIDTSKTRSGDRLESARPYTFESAHKYLKFRNSPYHGEKLESTLISRVNRLLDKIESAPSSELVVSQDVTIVDTLLDLQLHYFLTYGYDDNSRVFPLIDRLLATDISTLDQIGLDIAATRWSEFLEPISVTRQ